MRNRIRNTGFVAIVLLALAACSQPEKESFEQLPDSTVVAVDTSVQDTATIIDDPVQVIRNVVEHINTTKLDSQQFEFTCDVKTHVTRYKENGKVVKVTVDFGIIGDVYAKEDYYYEDSKLIFMYEFVEGGPACEGCIKKNEYRYYIKEGKVFKYLKDKNVAQCRKCEFGPKSRQYQILTATTTEQVKAVVCR